MSFAVINSSGPDAVSGCPSWDADVEKTGISVALSCQRGNVLPAFVNVVASVQMMTLDFEVTA